MAATFHKISIVGVGTIGSLIADTLMTFDLKELRLFDASPDFARGRALDLAHKHAGLNRFDLVPEAGESAADLKGSSLVVIAASVPYTRIDQRAWVIQENAKIISEWAQNVANYCPEAFVLMITNPVDVMTYLFQITAGHAPKKIIGLSSELGKARLKFHLAQHIKREADTLEIPVLGAHWPNPFYLYSAATFEGEPLSMTIPEEDFEKIAAKAAEGGAGIMASLKTQSTAFAPAMAACRMIAQLEGRGAGKISGSVILSGEYGWQHVAAGMDVALLDQTLGAIKDYPLSASEQQHLDASISQTARILENLHLPPIHRKIV